MFAKIGAWLDATFGIIDYHASTHGSHHSDAKDHTVKHLSKSPAEAKVPTPIANSPKVSGPAKVAKSGKAGPGGGAPLKDTVLANTTKRGQTTVGKSANVAKRDAQTKSATTTQKKTGTVKKAAPKKK